MRSIGWSALGLGVLSSALLLAACKNGNSGPDGERAGAAGASGSGEHDGGAGDSEQAGNGGRSAGSGGRGSSGDAQTGTSAAGKSGAGGVPALGAAPSVPLAPECALKYPKAWLAPDGESLVAVCGAKLATLPLDGSAPTILATPSGSAPANVFMDRAGLFYVDRSHLMRARFGEDTPETVAIDVRGPVAMSPDEQHVLYFAPGESTAASTLFAAPVDGGTPRPIHTPSWPANEFLLTPDGSRVLLMTRPIDLVSIAVSGEGAVELGGFANNPRLADSIAFSPDGTKLAFLGEIPNALSGYELVVASLDGSERVSGGTFETGGSSALGLLTFLPDASRVVVLWMAQQQPTEKYRLHTVPAEGGDATELARADFVRVFGIVGEKRDAVLYAARLGNASPTLSIISAEGGAPTKLSTLDGCAVLDIQYNGLGVSPDGTRAVYTDVFGDLVMADLEAATVETLVPRASTLGRICAAEPPLWSPDGTMIAHQRCTADGCESLVITPSGDVVTPIAGPPWFFSQDSQRLVTKNQIVSFGGPTLTFEGRVPLVGQRRDPRSPVFAPSTFPWLDDNRFLIESSSSPSTTVVIGVSQ